MNRKYLIGLQIRILDNVTKIIFMFKIYSIYYITYQNIKVHVI